MNKKELNRLLDKTRFSQKSRDIAVKVIIDGEQQIDVARKYDVARQRVSAIIQRVMEEQSLPDHWVFVSATLPPDLAEKVQEMEREAINNLLTK